MRMGSGVGLGTVRVWWRRVAIHGQKRLAVSAWQKVIGLVSNAAPKTGAPRAHLDERMGRGTFPPQGGGGKRQEASQATGKKARRKVFGMRM